MGRGMAFDVRQYLDRLARNFGQRPGLERIAFLLRYLGEPHRRYRVVHVAGTKGKGSTATLISSILQEAGLRVGLYTSPHLVRYNERIQVDGVPISDAELEAAFRRLWPGVEAALANPDVGQPTEFEVGTALAFDHFAARQVEVAVVEVGLGGRLDATNVVQPDVAVITPIGLDHTEVLGDTIGQIAGEKAGIIKPGVPVVISPQVPEAWAVLQATAAARSAALVEVGWDVIYRVRALSPRGTVMDVRGRLGEYPSLEVGLAGSHQGANAATALAAVEVLTTRGVPVAEAAIRRGLAKGWIPGRFEVVAQRPTVVLDGAHNPVAAAALARALEEVFPGRRPVFVVGLQSEKPVLPTLAQVLPAGRAVVCTRARWSRLAPLSPEELARWARLLVEEVHTAGSAGEALELACRLAGPDGLVCCWGSLYLIGELRAAWPMRPLAQLEPTGG